MRYLNLISIAIISVVGGLSWPDSHMAQSVSYADVVAAISVAESGDTVFVPAGSATWSSSLSISKGIKLQGAGIGATFIIGNITNKSSALIWYSPAKPESDEPFDLSGFTFDGKSTTCDLVIFNTSNKPITKVRVFQNKFIGGNYIGLKVVGAVYGVAYLNQFENNYMDCEVLGNDQASYDNQTSSYGTANAFFFEENSHSASISIFENSNGAQFVYRYNTINNWANVQMMDLHGNNHNPVLLGYTQARAPLNGEVYGNNFHSTRSGSGHKLMYHRGGSLLMYDNTITGTSSNSYNQLTEEDDWADHIIPAIVTHGGTNYICKQDHLASSQNEPSTAGGVPYWDLTSIVPNVYVNWTVGHYYRFSTSYDVVIDSYFYNNTENGHLVPVELQNATDNKYIKENQNYWLLDPRGRSIKSKIYQPYTFPHPLRSSSNGGTPSAPSRLRVIGS